MQLCSGVSAIGKALPKTVSGDWPLCGIIPGSEKWYIRLACDLRVCFEVNANDSDEFPPRAGKNYDLSAFVKSIPLVPGK